MISARDIESHEENLRARFMAFTADLEDARRASTSPGSAPHIENPIKKSYDGGMGDLPSRVAVLEQIAKDTRDLLKEMRDDSKAMRERAERDFRLLFGSIIAVALGIAGLMAHGFKWI